MSVGQKVVSAVGWSALIKIGFQAVNWAMTLLVIRILSPDDYGLMAISQVAINFMWGFANVGLGASLVQRDQPPSRSWPACSASCSRRAVADQANAASRILDPD